MKIAPQWDEWSVPFCAPTCPAYVPCTHAATGHVCIPAVRSIVDLHEHDYWTTQALQDAVNRNRELNGYEP